MKEVLKNWIEFGKSWFEDRRLRKQYQRDFRDSVKRNWLERLKEKIFILLDYDPTNSESGEHEIPSVGRAFAHWSYRVLWSRRIEIFGTVMLTIIGLICYSAISNANSETKKRTSSPDVIRSTGSTSN